MAWDNSRGNNFNDTNEKTSAFGDAMGQIHRLDICWLKVMSRRESGNMQKYRWTLDSIQLELGPDLERIAEGKKFKDKLAEIERRITDAFEEKDYEGIYSTLKEKEALLRLIQEKCGKLTKLMESEEEFV